jgi:hypothetical protein
MDAVALVHLVCTLLMGGVILFVQVVHYPLFARVGVEAFVRYELDHSTRTTWVVAPLMIGELVCALWLALRPGSAEAAPVAWAGLVLVVAIWLSTALLQVPAHARLAQGFDAAAWRRLVRTNWFRTGAWALRVPIALVLVGP